MYIKFKNKITRAEVKLWVYKNTQTKQTYVIDYNIQNYFIVDANNNKYLWVVISILANDQHVILQVMQSLSG